MSRKRKPKKGNCKRCGKKENQEKKNEAQRRKYT